MPQLVTVAGQEIELHPGGSYTLGRDPWCDVVVQDRACSRRHARISVSETGDEAHVEDLQSRNGTFLNGRRVNEPVPVPDGGQVRLGSTIFIFTYEGDVDCDLEGETRESFSQDTLFLEAPIEAIEGGSLIPEGDAQLGISGQLSAVSFSDLLQILTQTRRCGTLRIRRENPEDGVASVELRDGRVLAAFFSDQEGIAALHALAQERRGWFRFVETDKPCVPNIDLPTPQLLLELCRVLDESSAYEES
ncbi:MAG: FHA domain-containing protein [Planctomycetes bacterium]|nr:FHA domain-containing protein [Planctomycetota bacterium]